MKKTDVYFDDELFCMTELATILKHRAGTKNINV